MKRTVIATFGVAGWHEWTDAPDVVAYLRAPHRHLFRFRVEADVSHGDREYEFHLLATRVKLHLIKSFQPAKETRGYDVAGLDFGSRSCEHLAAFVLDEIPEVSACEVWEDDENGARVTRT